MIKVAVVGSIAMDLVVTSVVRPGAGETVLGEGFVMVPGGKGANQAVAAARLGADVSMIGCVGDDHYGQQLIDNLKHNGVSVKYVKPVTEVSTGTAHIVLAEGDNSIVVVKGANDCVTPEYVEGALEAIKEANIVLVQQEIPFNTIEYLSGVCANYRIPLLLNPAPAHLISQNVIEQATFITPNEHEAKLLFPDMSLEGVLNQYATKVLITEGSKGVRYHNGKEEVIVPTFKVEAVDTTGAGDTFNGAFAVAVAEGKNIADSLRFANRAASLSVTKFGAQGGMPSRKEVEESLS
ncbi:ribokinase [Bacillus sp. AGMB 02131]|uniref:Ribokinase n=1 Tax=Peribacillus faecalis TaxID=2772559 RepID=A0A927HCP0_9BACI|nr:ribokinase [Peribacillus faecalis]MBD3110244.1 ribokinase [Peribacillus faecalis]